ncbi:uncharacterized protein LOC144441922 [Glandiceps talaboti]
MNPAYPSTPGGYPATGSSYGPPPGSAGSHSGSLGFNPNVIPGPGGGSSYPYTSVSAVDQSSLYYTSGDALIGTYLPAAQSSSLHQSMYSKTGSPTYSQASSPTGAPPPYTPTPSYTYQPPHLSAPQYVTPQPTYPSSMTQFTPQYSPSPVIHHTTVVQQPVRTVYVPDHPYENAMAGGMSASSALSMAAMQRPTSYPSPYTSPYQPRLGYHWWEDTAMVLPLTPDNFQ